MNQETTNENICIHCNKEGHKRKTNKKCELYQERVKVNNPDSNDKNKRQSKAAKTNRTFPLLQLPNELLLGIINNLDSKDVLNLLKVNRFFNSLGDDNNEWGRLLWKNLRVRMGLPDPNLIGMSDKRFLHAYHGQGCDGCHRHKTRVNIWEFKGIRLCPGCIRTKTESTFDLQNRNNVLHSFAVLLLNAMERTYYSSYQRSELTYFVYLKSQVEALETDEYLEGTYDDLATAKRERLSNLCQFKKRLGLWEQRRMEERKAQLAKCKEMRWSIMESFLKEQFPNINYTEGYLVLDVKAIRNFLSKDVLPTDVMTKNMKKSVIAEMTKKDVKTKILKQQVEIVLRTHWGNTNCLLSETGQKFLTQLVDDPDCYLIDLRCRLENVIGPWLKRDAFERKCYLDYAKECKKLIHLVKQMPAFERGTAEDETEIQIFCNGYMNNLRASILNLTNEQPQSTSFQCNKCQRNSVHTNSKRVLRANSEAHILQTTECNLDDLRFVEIADTHKHLYFCEQCRFCSNKGGTYDSLLSHCANMRCSKGSIKILRSIA